MLTTDTMCSNPADHGGAKRKFPGDGGDPALKRPRTLNPAADTFTPSSMTATTSHNPHSQGHTSLQQPQPSSSAENPSSPYVAVYEPLAARLGDKYNIKPMSVMPSTNIGKHVERALEHLDRFDNWNKSVVPGVVLLCARMSACSKLVTVSEVVRRRIAESEQKWFQYNLLSETVGQGIDKKNNTKWSLEDKTFGGTHDNKGEEEEDEYFERMKQAVSPAKEMHTAHMTVLLSRVPIPELKGTRNMSLQTNEEHIEYLRKRRQGLIG